MCAWSYFCRGRLLHFACCAFVIAPLASGCSSAEADETRAGGISSVGGPTALGATATTLTNSQFYNPALCGANRVDEFIGETVDGAIHAQIESAVGHRDTRWIAPNAYVSTDLRPDRLNVLLDSRNGIVEVLCG